MSAFLIDDETEVECTQYQKPVEKIHLYSANGNTPSELGVIMQKWYEMSRAVGDHGSCVIGAGFSFTWNGNEYFMSACSPYQGSISWETNKEDVRKMLENAGATNIYYDWGRMD